MIGPALALLLAGAVIPRSTLGPGDEGSTARTAPADSSGPGQADVPRNDGDKPFKPPSGEPLDFRGPGREEPEPDVDEVVLGWFGPGDPDHPDFGDLWRGATLALEQENAAGGYRGELPARTRRSPGASRSASCPPGRRARGRPGSRTSRAWSTSEAPGR